MTAIEPLDPAFARSLMRANVVRARILIKETQEYAEEIGNDSVIKLIPETLSTLDNLFGAIEA